MKTETQLRVINSQWLYDEPAEIISETAHTVTVKHGSETQKFHKNNGLQFGFSNRQRVDCEPNRLLGYNAEHDSYAEPGIVQLTLFDQLRAEQLDTALEQAIKEIQTSNEQKQWFIEYHEHNLHIFEKFCELTLETINKGFRHYGAMSIIQLMRWHTGARASNDKYKINNNASPFYARMFESVYSEHRGFFGVRRSSAD